MKKVLILFAAMTFISISVVSATDTGIPLHLFGDAGYGQESNTLIPREKVKGFALGTFDLYINPQFGDQVRALAEIALEPGLDSQAESLDVERAQVGYYFNDYLTVWVGRFHTPIGYWVTSYHHGAQTQPSLYKPRFLDWEDHAGVLPVHSTGLWFTGKTELGSGKLLYDLWDANGSKNVNSNGTQGALDMNIIRDDNSNNAWGWRLKYQFGDTLDGLTLGLHGFYEQIDNYDANLNWLGTGAAVKMYGAFAVYENHGFETDAEYYLFQNTNSGDLTNTLHSSWAGFAHIGYYISPDWLPYLRLERAVFDQGDQFFQFSMNGFSYDRGVLGVRYNVSFRSCIKIEYNRTWVNTTNSNAQIGVADEIRSQYAFTF